MNCDLAIELLPWLLNGTLDDAERQQVREHLATCQPCRNAWQETAAAAALFDWHPPAAELVAAASGEAVPPLLAEHLAACPQCAADVELARTGRLLLESGAAGDGASVTLLRPAVPHRDRATARTWQRAALAAGLTGLLALGGWLASARHGQVLEARLARAAAPPAARGAGAASGGGPTSRASSPGAAGIANGSGSSDGGAGATSTSQAAELGREAVAAQAKLDELARQNQALQARVIELGRLASATAARAAAATGTTGGAGAAGADRGAPAIESSVWTDELTANGQALRGGEATAPAAIPLSAGAATLLLRSRHAAGTAAAAGTGGDEAFEVEIHDAQDRRVGTAVTVARRRDSSDAAAEFDVILRRGALAPGSYTLQLFGRSPAGRKLVDSYSLRVS